MAYMAIVGMGIHVVGSENATIECTIVMQVPVHGTMNKVVGSTVTMVLNMVNVMNGGIMNIALVLNTRASKIATIVTTAHLPAGVGIMPILVMMPS